MKIYHVIFENSMGKQTMKFVFSTYEKAKSFIHTYDAKTYNDKEDSPLDFIYLNEQELDIICDSKEILKYSIYLDGYKRLM